MCIKEMTFTIYYRGLPLSTYTIIHAIWTPPPPLFACYIHNGNVKDTQPPSRRPPEGTEDIVQVVTGEIVGIGILVERSTISEKGKNKSFRI